MIFFTADQHFWHRNIIRPDFCGSTRPFDSIEDMNQAIVERHNETVGPDDTVWMLGDIGFNDAKTFPILESLNGELCLIRGNHDSKKMARWAGWKAVGTRVDLLVEGAWVALQHHPTTRWPGQSKGRPLLHGHSHGQHKVGIENAYDVGVDCWDLRPVTLSDILGERM